jgi:NADH-dependent peroxiredoxin subunit F
MNKKIFDLIIVGAGPAGMTAGIYASRQGLKILIITKDFGGQIGKKTVDIENYPGFEKISGQELIKKFSDQVSRYEVEVKNGEVTKIEKKENGIFSVFVGKKYEYNSLAVIVATGADPRPLEVAGEKEFVGKGVSYCALCDGPLFKNKTVAVIGGGNSAFETVRFLANYVAKIYILEAGKEVKADEENQEIVRNINKAEIITSASLKEIKGDKFVKSLIYEDLSANKTKELEISGIFVEIGYQPATAFVKGLVDFSERDEIIVEFETCQTKTPGLYAAGDSNVGKYKQIITACGEGAKAALAAYSYIQQVKIK